MLSKKIRFLCATLASSVVLNSAQILIDSTAYAARSGGRSSGGSFSRPSSNSPSRSSGSDSGGSTTPSRTDDRYYGDRYYGDRYYGSGYSNHSSNGGGAVLFVVVLLLIGGAGFFVWYLLKTGKKERRGELDNNVVTVTKVQVGLLAEGRAIQSTLATIVQDADTDSIEGLHAELQEAVLALLRMPENWSHVCASSKTVKTREEAEKAFYQLSITERTKYTTETLTNAGGKLIQKEFEIDPEKAPAAYIVVTLLLGTADDKPLLSEIRTIEALKATLNRFAAFNQDYLMRFELQWTPQAEGDRLTYDEMLMDYPEMLQL